MGLRRPLIAVAIVATLAAAACTSPQEEIGDRVVDAVRDGGDSPVMPRFTAASADFEQAVQSFNNSPIDTPAALKLADERLRELRRAFDEWSLLVDEVTNADIKGTPKAELRAWRDAAEEWIAAQEAITRAMLACDYEVACIGTAQARHTPVVVAATARAQEAKRRFVAAVPDE